MNMVRIKSDKTNEPLKAGEVVNQRAGHLKSFVLNRQESDSNPLLHIHANR